MNIMKRLTILFICMTALTAMVAAQGNDPVLMTVAGEKITKSEFLNVYNKNNIKDEPMDRKSLENYLDLYINFKLKVKEAEENKLDTAISFKTELSGYRKQLAQPYLTDKSVDESLLQEAYDRMQWDIRASHILIMKVQKITENKTTKTKDTTWVNIDYNALPEDTLIAYQKIMKIRERILKGESFEKLAMEFSDDKSAQDKEDPSTKSVIKGNGGDLGYFSVLDMIYPFETGAYNAKIGEISMPIRTDYGYHLIKVTERQPAMGKAVVAHIYVSVPKDAKPEDLATYKTKIDEAYSRLKKGESFEELVTLYSDDKGSASKGGVLPGFGVNRMVPEFIVAINKLKQAGDYSEPVQTMYGWHIIKLIEKKPPKSFDEEKAMLKTRILKDSRSNKSKESMIARIKKDYGFTEFKETVKDFYTVVDSTVFEGLWNASAASALNKPMIKLAEITYTQKDFADYLSVKQSRRAKMHIPSYINEKYTSFVDDKCIAYEDSKLEEKYPEFKALMKEYRDGILLFELTDKKVWSKAIQDTAGLKAFYEINKNNYMWPERLDASIYTCNNATTAANAKKLAKNVLKGKLSESDLLKSINTDSIPSLSIEHKFFVKGDNAIIDSVQWVKGIYDVAGKNDKVVFVVVHALRAPEPKAISEAKGIITADYQNFLENEWIKSLKAKYTVEVNKDVFETLIKE